MPAPASALVFTLIFVPTMLLFPLVFAAVVPNRADDDAARIKARGLLTMLALCTAVLLAIWGGLVLIGVRPQDGGNLPLTIARFWWPWFFPLWFLLAMPAIAAKNPHWGWAVGGPASACVRSASLVNRERTSPVTTAMWAFPIAATLLVIAAIAARGLLPFGVGPYPGDSAIDPEAARIAYAEAERSRWRLSLLVYAPILVLLLAILPVALRRTLTEPEPMDAAGSEVLAELYARHRRRRVLGLFWGIGTVLPLCIGSLGALTLWLPDLGSLWGIVGGIVGTVAGLGGAAFGISMTVERAKIAAARARLEPPDAANAA